MQKAESNRSSAMASGVDGRNWAFVSGVASEAVNISRICCAALRWKRLCESRKSKLTRLSFSSDSRKGMHARGRFLALMPSWLMGGILAI